MPRPRLPHSGLINLLYLTGPFFMLEIYDRVIPSRSVPTLVGLAMLAGALFAFQGVLDLIRGRVFIRGGAALDQRLSGRVFDALARLPLKSRAQGDGLQPLRDLDQVRSFLASGGPLALFDLPWMPLYLALCFFFHVSIGVAALGGAALLVSLTLLTEIFSRKPTREAAGHAIARNALAESSRRNAEVLAAMGMGPQVGAVWAEANATYMASQQKASDVTTGLGALSKVLRLMLQSGVLGLGAYLVLHQEVTAGIIIASSILVSRALAPVELAIGHWRGFLSARQSWRRLNELLALLPAREAPMPLPKPAKSLAVEGISVMPPGEQRLVVQDAALKLEAGTARARPASPRSPVRWSGCGRRCAAASGSTARRSSNGRPRLSAGISAICRRMSSSSTARWHRTSPASTASPIRRRSSGPRRRPGCTS
jgi:ABC-type protease/lipase transport system fused ATPase/permease subunit